MNSSIQTTTQSAFAKAGQHRALTRALKTVNGVGGLKNTGALGK